MKILPNTLRGWLIENDYAEIAQIIDDIILEWQKSGNKQRRNWWDILAGDKNGKSRIIAGRVIPVLKAAQVRKGIKVTPNAICKSEKEKAPLPLRENTKWNKA